MEESPLDVIVLVERTDCIGRASKARELVMR